jgi:hypothetical protein
MAETRLPEKAKLDRLTPEAREALEKAFEEKRIADEKAKKADEHARTMLASVNLSEQVVTSSSESSEELSSSLETAREEGRKGKKEQNAKKGEKTIIILPAPARVAGGEGRPLQKGLG